jgi:hypothetical protein
VVVARVGQVKFQLQRVALAAAGGKGKPVEQAGLLVAILVVPLHPVQVVTQQPGKAVQVEL